MAELRYILNEEEYKHFERLKEESYNATLKENKVHQKQIALLNTKILNLTELVGKQLGDIYTINVDPFYGGINITKKDDEIKNLQKQISLLKQRYKDFQNSIYHGDIPLYHEIKDELKFAIKHYNSKWWRKLFKK